jgi:hypothetical protein
MTKPRLSAQEKAWRAQSDLQTLQNAQAIQTDRSRMAAARLEAKKTIQAVQQVVKKTGKK